MGYFNVVVDIMVV